MWLSFLPLRASHRNKQISKNSEVKSKEDGSAAPLTDWPSPEEGARWRHWPGAGVSARAGREKPGGLSRASTCETKL